MSKQLKILVITFLIIVSVYFKFNGIVKAQSQDLSILIVPPKSPIYVGVSFILEARVINQNTALSHNYRLVWEVDGYWWFTTQGTIDPNETISLTPSFTFPTAGYHVIFIEIYEDEAKTGERNLSVTVIKVDSSLIYSFDPSPIYPDISSSVTLVVINEGSQTISNTSVRVYPFAPEVGIELQYGLFSYLGNITSGHSNSTTLPFSVEYDVEPGVYSLKVHVEFYDALGYLHEKNHYVPIQILSGETRDKVDILEPEMELLEKSLKDLENTMLLNMTYIAIALIVVNAVTAALNYWYARKSARRARARAKILKK